MVQWTDLVGSNTVNSFVTYNTLTYGYKNNVTLNTGPAINVLGNPAGFFSGNVPWTNINDGRTRNATRMFIYNALLAESDYNDAQAAAYGDTTTDEFIIRRGTRPAALTGSGTWPVSSIITSGSRVSANAASTVTLELVAVRDRNGHVRAWKMKSGLDANSARLFSTAYDKMSDAEIRTEFGLPGGTPPQAVTGTFNPGAKALTLQDNTRGTFEMDAASGGTGTISYGLTSPPAGFGRTSGRTISVAPNVAAGAYTLRGRAIWTSGSSVVSLTRSFQFTLTRTSPPAVAGAFRIANKQPTLPTIGDGSFDFEPATGGTGTITYGLVGAAPGIRLQGTKVIIPDSIAGGLRNFAIQATWTSGTSTASAVARFTANITRDASLNRSGSGGMPPWVYRAIAYRREQDKKKRKRKK